MEREREMSRERRERREEKARERREDTKRGEQDRDEEGEKKGEGWPVRGSDDQWLPPCLLYTSPSPRDS